MQKRQENEDLQYSNTESVAPVTELVHPDLKS